jgi:energy-coupling factor transporter ATP-binding protein EcfA2
VLKLKKYSFSGIGRFAEKQTIDLESRSHLIQIDGHNTNTGGSSGAGKSTTVEALAFLLGISEIPATQLQSRITDSPIWVQGEFEGDIIITRSKKDGLVIQTPEETVSGNSKLAEEKLDEIIGVNRDLLKTMCYRRQKQGGFFLNLTPKQSYEFLIQCLGLREYQTKINKLEDIIKNQYKPNRIELDSSIKTLTEGIAQLEILLHQKIRPIAPEKIDIDSLQLLLEVLSQKRLNLKIQFDQNVELIGSKPIKSTSIVFEKQEELDTINNQISKLNIIMNNNIVSKGIEVEQTLSAVNKIREKINEINQLKKNMIEIDSYITKLEQQQQHLLEGNCPTCLREWENEENNKKLIQINEEIQNKKQTVQKHIKDIEKFPHYKMMESKALELLEQKKNTKTNVLEEKDLLELQEKQRILLNEKENIQSIENQRYLEKLNNWNQQFSFLNDNYRESESKIINEINDIKNQIDRANINNKNYKETLAGYEKDCQNIKDKINSSNKELNNKVEELKEIERNTVLSEESVRLIKNFTLQKFQDTLDYIGQRATEIINLIPNMANAVIFFENSKETKTGSIKNEVNAVMNLEGDSSIPIKTLSGGERTSADFAIDLAVGEMIENMTQKGVNFLIIDEGFDGLDSISKIECLEILKNLNTDKKILMVDHSSEVKEMLCDTIVVKRIGEKSVINE